MKKRAIIFTAAIISFSITAFSLISWSPISELECSSAQKKNIVFEQSNLINILGLEAEPEFHFAVGTRFEGIEREKLLLANSIHDFLTKDQMADVESYLSVRIVIIENDRQTDIRIWGEDDVLTEEQKELLRSMDYSSNFTVRADYRELISGSGQLRNNYFSPHLTVVPEKQVEYSEGNEGIIEFIRKQSRAEVAKVNRDSLYASKLYFTIDTVGKVKGLYLNRTCNYPELDQKVFELIQELPGTWTPAENGKGKKVEQELVFSYGMMGC